jgi:hypothetical protein
MNSTRNKAATRDKILKTWLWRGIDREVDVAFCSTKTKREMMIGHEINRTSLPLGPAGDEMTMMP